MVSKKIPKTLDQHLRCGLAPIRQFKADLRNFAQQFGLSHSEQWERNPRKARELAVRYFRKYLPRGRPGRPRSSEVTRALELLEQGKRWPFLPLLSWIVTQTDAGPSKYDLGLQSDFACGTPRRSHFRPYAFKTCEGIRIKKWIRIALLSPVIVSSRIFSEHCTPLVPQTISFRALSIRIPTIKEFAGHPD